MIRRNKILISALAFAFTLSVYHTRAQEQSCRVLLPNISGTYSGDCKNGLADGRGTAQGVDKYYGQFDKGLPEGKGTYTWADGSYYEGQWKQGMREGKGKMVYKDSTITGYWRTDKYIGQKLVAPYKITRSISVTRYSISKVPGTNNFIRIKFMRGGLENADISDLSLAYSSGDEYRIGPSYGLQHCQFPLDIIVRFRAWNYFHTTQYDVNFEFTINEAATWEVVISY